MSQHTPGPWRQNGDVIFDSNYCPIACRGAYAPEARGELIDSDGWMAGNARLIAKAPEMLAILKRLDAKDGVFDDWHQHTEGATNEMFDVVSEASALLKEIEG